MGPTSTIPETRPTATYVHVDSVTPESVHSRIAVAQRVGGSCAVKVDGVDLSSSGRNLSHAAEVLARTGEEIARQARMAAADARWRLMMNSLRTAKAALS